jgi:hypothetical protein
MAAPFVAGLAARALREAPSLSGYQLKVLLMQTADKTPYLKNKAVAGARVNALNVMQASQQMVSMSSAQPTYNPSYLVDRSLASSSDAGAADLLKQ